MLPNRDWLHTMPADRVRHHIHGCHPDCHSLDDRSLASAQTQLSRVGLGQCTQFFNCLTCWRPKLNSQLSGARTSAHRGHFGNHSRFAISKSYFDSCHEVAAAQIRTGDALMMTTEPASVQRETESPRHESAPTAPKAAVNCDFRGHKSRRIPR